MLDRHKQAEERRDFRAAMICSVLANCNRDPKRRQQPFSPRDFMPRTEPEPKQTWQEQLSIVSGFFEGLKNRGKR